MADQSGQTQRPATTYDGYQPDDTVDEPTPTASTILQSATTNPTTVRCWQMQSPSWVAAVVVALLILFLVFIVGYCLGRKKLLDPLCQHIRTCICSGKCTTRKMRGSNDTKSRHHGAGTNERSAESQDYNSEGDDSGSEGSPLSNTDEQSQDDVTRASSAGQFSRSNPTHVLRDGLHQRKRIINPAFRKNWAEITRTLGFGATLTCAMKLQSKGIISQAEYDSIMAETHSVVRAFALCDILTRKSERDILAFVDILDATLYPAE